MKKHSAPSEVHQFEAARLSIEPVAGTTNEATAEMPNSTHPSRFTAAIVAALSIRAGRMLRPAATQ
ncbi:hypothetical protein AB0H36_31620 [Kribbella sp. NPDC050820]|uniref:hypothetical protein n=1 Tax=Kribbella sp. NPDC050820 TaxID=3155408 RepID=UPI0033E253EF